MENFKDLYKEHEAIITNKLPEIKHVDLWHEQVGFLQSEHPFKAPAVFFAYRILKAEDQGEKTQNVTLGIDVYYYYETFADTHRRSKKQNKALDFLDTLTKIHAVFHGSSGTNYCEMRRVGFQPVETGTANILYVQRFECIIVDSSARVLFEDVPNEDIDIQITNEAILPVEIEDSSYVIDMRH